MATSITMTAQKDFLSKSMIEWMNPICCLIQSKEYEHAKDNIEELLDMLSYTLYISGALYSTGNMTTIKRKMAISILSGNFERLRQLYILYRKGLIERNKLVDYMVTLERLRKKAIKGKQLKKNKT